MTDNKNPVPPLVWWALGALGFGLGAWVLAKNRPEPPEDE